MNRILPTLGLGSRLAERNSFSLIAIYGYGLVWGLTLRLWLLRLSIHEKILILCIYSILRASRA